MCPKCGSERDHKHTWCRRCVRSWHLERKYGITADMFDEMLVAQEGECAICGTREPGGRGNFHVDHDHESGRVRALLCYPCNTMLGVAQDDPERLRTAAAYLERF